ncbi:hypothetical protein P7K49_018547, partial [Saguinus oedipus]
RLLAYPKLSRLCAIEEMVRSVTADSSPLSSDGSAVVAGTTILMSTLTFEPSLFPELQGLSESCAHLEFRTKERTKNVLP